MTTQAIVIADSVGHLGQRITSFQLRYQRYIHGEFMTHRVYGRNASSSRAIPVEKLIALAISDPAMFDKVGTNKPGMQAGAEVSPEIREQFEREWLELRDIAIGYARRWAKELHIAKEVVNRAVEPWHHISVIATSSQEGLDNFYALRDSEMAQPEIATLARLMRHAQNESRPRVLRPGDWHLPYVLDEERATNKPFTLAVWSAARCARVSYLNHDGTTSTPEADEALFSRLALAAPPHLSPLEHQAVMAPPGVRRLSGNLDPSWVQFRKLMEQSYKLPLSMRLESLATVVNNPYLLAR